MDKSIHYHKEDYICVFFELIEFLLFSSNYFFFENYQGTFYLDVWQDTDIQDMGSTQDIYDIAFAPTSGWSSSKSVYAQVGHTYVIWTWNNHYAKIRISAITNNRIVFDWAYQLVKGETQLKPGGNSGKRNKIDKSILK